MRHLRYWRECFIIGVRWVLTSDSDADLYERYRVAFSEWRGDRDGV